MLLIAADAVYAKVGTPYTWPNYEYPPMFESRKWYRRPRGTASRRYGGSLAEPDFAGIEHDQAPDDLLVLDLGSVPPKAFIGLRLEPCHHGLNLFSAGIAADMVELHERVSSPGNLDQARVNNRQ